MAELRLTECDVAVISTKKEIQRRESASALCTRLGLSFGLIDGIECSPGFIGCGLSHLRALRAWTCKRPLLILEDDIASTADYVDTISIPNDTDAIYLGTSSSGTLECYDHVHCSNSVVAETVCDGIVRVWNMLSSHAIVHLTKSWREGVIEELTKAIIDDNIPMDVGLVKVQARFNVYALRRPVFYQSAEFQRPGLEGQESTTVTPIPVYEVGTILTIGGGARLRLTRHSSRLAWELL
jgi:hypothetical protein